jgi:uncharacterized protein
MSKVATVKYIYDRFAQGDGPAILRTFTDDVEFRLAEGHPYQPAGEPWVGGEAVASNFFAKAGSEWKDWRFDIHEVIETPEAVVVEGRYSAVYQPTGRELDAQGCHIWRFLDGRVARFHQYVDTAQVQYVMGSPLWPPQEEPSVFPGIPAEPGLGGDR